MLQKKKAGMWLTESTIPKYKTILLDKDNLILITNDYLIPIEFLNEGTHSVPSKQNQGSPQPERLLFFR